MVHSDKKNIKKKRQKTTKNKEYLYNKKKQKIKNIVYINYIQQQKTTE